MAAEIVVFDLNGTLLDLSALDPHFQRIFGLAEHREKWFQQLQTLWMTTIACGTFERFDKLAQAALRMLAEKESVKLSSADQKAVVGAMTELPPFRDVAPSLQKLRDAKYQLVALTNGGLRSAKAQLKHANLSDWI